MKEAANVLGIVTAWLLSIVLILMLTVTPIVFSALSLLNPDTITEVVVGALTSVVGEGGNASAAESAKAVTLSATTGSSVAEDAGKDILEDLFDDDISQEQVAAILSTNVAKKLIEAYTSDLSNAITGSGKEASFNAEKLKRIVNDNIDELVEVLQANVPACADLDSAELKDKIQKAVDENAEEIVAALPKPEELKQQLTEESPAIKMAMEILAAKDMLKLMIIGVIVVLSGLIFACRIPGMRGFRWLATDLFVGGGCNGLITVSLLAGKSVASDAAGQMDIQLAGLVGPLLDAFANGMLVRTIVMLIAGAGLLTAYILLKKHRAAKTVMDAEAQA